MNHSRQLFNPWLGATVAIVASASVSYAALSPEQLAQQARKFTVQIQGPTFGSGVLIARNGNTYTILTAAHVVESINPGEEASVITAADNQTHALNTNTIDKSWAGRGVDLAIVKFQSSKSYQVAKIASQDRPSEGAAVHVAGFPSLGAVNSVYSFTEGRIVGVATEASNGYELIYSNKTGRGMSGGPVLNQRGELVGIHGQAELTTGDKFNFGIPIAYYKNAPASSTTVAAASPPPPSPPPPQPSQEAASGNPNPSASGELPPEEPEMAEQEQVLAFLQDGRTLGREEQPEQLVRARAAFDSAIELDPENAAAYRDRGYIKRQLGDLGGAIDDYNRAIELDPQDAIAHNNRGYLYFLRGNYSRAIDDYNRAIELDRNFAAAYNNRGVTRHTTGNAAGAKQDFQQALNLNPNFRQARQNLERVR